mgnify:CR=1 FL=1
MTTSGSGSLFTGIYSGLTNTYSLLAGQYPNGVTLSNISTARTNTNLASQLNPTFTSYIQSNFTSLDADQDGVLSPTELTNLTNQISTQGLTATQLTQLGAASGMSNQTLEQVLEHFHEMDTNNDGRVTSAEISAYKLTSAMEEKKTEFSNRAAGNMSVFYGDDSSSAADSSSLLSYKYMNNGSSSTSGTMANS